MFILLLVYYNLSFTAIFERSLSIIIRTQVGAFHVSFQALIENILLQDCLLEIEIIWTM